MESRPFRIYFKNIQTSHARLNVCKTPCPQAKKASGKFKQKYAAGFDQITNQRELEAYQNQIVCDDCKQLLGGKPVGYFLTLGLGPSCGQAQCYQRGQHFTNDSQDELFKSRWIAAMFNAHS